MHLKPIEPLTIEAIRAHEFCGNAWSDGPAFASIDKFARDTNNTVAHRAEAIRIMSLKGMGLLTPVSNGEADDLRLLASFDDQN